MIELPKIWPAAAGCIKNNVLRRLAVLAAGVPVATLAVLIGTVRYPLRAVCRVPRLFKEVWRHPLD